MSRIERSRAALAAYRNAAPELRAQRRDDWLRIATGAEVRRAWAGWMGAMPPWAARPWGVRP